VNLRSGSGRHREPDVNLTPLIDVVFLLLIFFMVSTSFTHESRLAIDLPETGEAPKDEAAPTPVELSIDAGGGYFIADRPLADGRQDTLRTALEKAFGEDRERPLVIRADARTPHQAVIAAMEAARGIGVLRLSFATRRALE
jgi:biopolymer transport protein ExbD